MSTKGNITLCLTSLAAGAVLGLLLAPASGRETRHNLVRRSGEMKDKLSDLYEEGSQFLDRQRSQITNAAERMRSNARETAEEVTDQVRSGAERARKEMGGSGNTGGRSATSSNGGTRA